MNNNINSFFDFIHRATSPVCAVNVCKNILENHYQFELISIDQLNQVKPNSKYIIIPFTGMLIAFVTGDKGYEQEMLKIVASHIDSPGFKLKTNPEIKVDGCIKLNTEVYGGPILHTWLDRPLGLSGEVAIKSNNPLKPTILPIDLGNFTFTIPNVAIHLNHEVNEKVSYNKQKHFQPIFNLNESDETVIQAIAAKLGVEAKEIIETSINLYVAEKAKMAGVNKDIITGPRLDNLVSTYASIMALAEETPKKGVNMAICYNHEEIGSLTKQGGQSNIIQLMLKCIMNSENDAIKWMKILMNSLVISADATHATHPNYKEKSDETNIVKLNGGVAIKYSANQKYATDCETAAIFKQLCETENVPYQAYVNRSDIRGGGTLGPMLESLTGIKTVDVGVPMLAMHSAREMMGKADFELLQKVFGILYKI